jgi:hypothetical protein
MRVGTVLGCLIRKVNLNILECDVVISHAMDWTADNWELWTYDPADDGPEVEVIRRVRRANA